MYNGIGLTTPRGSGTNGHVQRNWAFVRPGKKDNSNYRSEEDIKKLDATLNRPPNKDILDHDRKRKIEVKCLEFEEILEKQGLSSDEIKSKVDSYREKLMGQGKSDIPKDDFGRILVRDSHQIAEAQQEKNAKLREAFNISEYFVEGSSFDSDRKAKEDLAKSLALQKELDIQRDQAAAASAKEKESSKRYTLVRTPSMEHDISSAGLGGESVDNDANIIKKKKKKRMRESSASPDRKKDKKKKSKKRKKESKPKKSKKFRKRKTSETESNAENDKKDTFDDDSESEIEAEAKKSRKRNKKEKRKRKNKKKELSLSSDNSRTASPVGKPIESKDNETIKWKNINEYEFRSRSKEKSHKSQKEAHDRFNRRSHIRSDRNKTKLRSSSRSDKNVSSQRSQSRIERSDRSCHDLRDSYQKLGSCSKGYRSRAHLDSTRNDKNLENRRSRSLQKSKRVIGTELCLKRKHSEDYSQRKSNSPKVAERKRYSRSHSTSLTRQNCGKKSYSQTESKPSRARSRTPKKKFSDSRRKMNKSRSKSKSRSGSISVVANLRKKSLTPPLQTSERVESKKYIFKSKEKSDADLTSCRQKDKTPRSRTISASSLNTASSTATRTSKSRTYSPKREHTEKDLKVKIFDTQKFIEQRQNSQSPSRTPTPATRRSESRSRIEASRSDKYHCGSIAKELLDKSKEKREEHKHLLSRTPPPFKVEKKIVSPRSSRDSSELSYSPARRNPERYRDILENSKIQKMDKCKISDKEKEKEGLVKSLKQSEERDCDRKERGGKSDRSQAKPIVRLQSQSDEDSDVPERNTEKILDEFLESKRDRELKDLKILEQLKTGIAAKAKEKIKTIEKMCASTSTNASLNNDGEVSDKHFKRTVRNSLNDFLAANNVAPAVVATCSTNIYNSMSNSTTGAIYPQTLEERKKEQESDLKVTEISSQLINNKNTNRDYETQTNCNKSLVNAYGHALPFSSTTTQTYNNINAINKDRDRKRERDFRERERERETNNFNKDRYLERRQRLSPNTYSTGGSGVCSGGLVGGRRNNNNNAMPNINHRQQRLNIMCNSGVVGGHHHNPHSHLHPHHHHPNHKIINNHHSSTSATYIANNCTNPHALMCNHANNSTNISFNRPSRINNTPLITATQFNNQMLNKQSNSILVNRRDHRTALNLGLSGTPCTNFSNSNLLLTKANPHHLHVAAVGHAAGGGHHHHHHYHHHHHGQKSNMSSGGNNPATQITDRILMAASIAAAQRNSLGVVHSAASSAAAVAAANNLNFLHQNKPKLVIKPFKINDSQPLVAALADSSLVDAIVSKVSTATVAAAESAARRSRSRSRRSHSRNRHVEKTSSGGSNKCGSSGERDANRRRSTSHSRSSRSSTSSRSRSRSQSRRSSRSRSSQSSSSSHTSSRSSSSSSFGSSRSGTRSPSIPRRRGSPSFLDRRRITSRHSSSRDRRR